MSTRYDYDYDPRGRGYDYGREEYGRGSQGRRLGYGGQYNEPYGRRSYERRFGRGQIEEYERGYAREGASGENAILIRLSDTDFDIADAEDIRGRMVLDQNRNDIGDVDDLIIDQRQQRVRFLQVTSGGFLGLGGTMLLIPVEAITNIGRDEVEIDQRGGRGFGTMRYNPTLTERGGYRAEDRGYYGLPYGGYTATGRYKGRGPRGYRRSDDRIKEDINDRLSDHAFLDASDIEVSVNNGEVTLSGTVNNRNDKRLAEDIAEGISGVTNVENRLRVTTAGETITRAAGVETTAAATGSTATGRGKTTTTS